VTKTVFSTFAKTRQMKKRFKRRCKPAMVKWPMPVCELGMMPGY
jgi:hypothetical protein